MNDGAVGRVRREAACISSLSLLMDQSRFRTRLPVCPSVAVFVLALGTQMTVS